MLPMGGAGSVPGQGPHTHQLFLFYPSHSQQQDRICLSWGPMLQPNEQVMLFPFSQLLHVAAPSVVWG